MIRGQRTVASLLAVVAVLLALNLMRAPATAAGASGACCWPNGDCVPMTPDGCASVNGTYQGDSTNCAAFNCIPVKPPTLIALSATQAFENAYGSATWRVFRGWSDGTVDHTCVGFNGQASCQVTSIEGPTPIVSAACTADANRNGEVEINDLLTMLSQWGPCE